MRELLTRNRTSVRSRARVVTALTATAILWACGGESADSAADSAPAIPAVTVTNPTVQILEPADGSTIDGPSVTVTLSVTGLTIAMAGDTTAGTGHHHLFLDRDVSPAGEPMPAEPGFIVHKGDGSSTHTFESVAPGEHRLIAVVGDGLHIPLQPWVTDTVHFTVR